MAEYMHTMRLLIFMTYCIIIFIDEFITRTYLSASRVAQWKRAGPITQRSVDRNHALLNVILNEKFYNLF